MTRRLGVRYAVILTVLAWATSAVQAQTQPVIVVSQTSPVVIGGSCTNQFTTGVTAGSGTPTCASVTGPTLGAAGTTSTELAGALTDETGTGAATFATAPTFTTSLTAPLVIMNATGGIIRANTSDAADTGVIALAGGGAENTARGAILNVGGNENASGFAGRVYVRLGTIAGSTFNVATSANAQILKLYDTGAIEFTNIAAGGAGDTDACLTAGNQLTDAGAASCIVSSLRYKDPIRPLGVDLEAVKQLRPSIYAYKEFDRTLAAGELRPDGRAEATIGRPRRERVGLYAEDMLAVEPRLVFFEADGVTPRGIGYEEYTALLTKWIQDLLARVEALESRVP